MRVILNIFMSDHDTGILPLQMHANRKEKKRKDYAFWRQFNEKPSIIPGCPECTPISVSRKKVSKHGPFYTSMQTVVRKAASSSEKALLRVD